MVRSAHPLRGGGCSSPVSHLCTGYSEQGPGVSTPGLNPQSHP